MYSSKYWMKFALQEAHNAFRINEVPVGAVVVYKNKIIGTGFNKVIYLNDATAHAEIIALRNAACFIKNYRLNFCDIYTTVEPCIMCFGAIINFRIQTVYFGTKQYKSGVIVSKAKLHKLKFLNHEIKVEGNILSLESKNLLKKFFFNKR